MLVPDHWAEARRRHRERGRQVTVRRFGWSTIGAEDAAEMAERRAEEALRRILAGEELPRREPRVPYNGAEGVPIREEVVSRHGEEVVTRNAYGARCLNSPRALFADVDFGVGASCSAMLVSLALLATAALTAGIVLRRPGLACALVAAAFVLAEPLAELVLRTLRKVRGGEEAIARRRLERFVRERPGWSVRVYRTPAGWRLLATHRPFEPSDPDVERFFLALGVDPVYATMCRRQNCFRARLSAKPWRIGIPSHLKPRPGIWPVAAEHLPRRTEWIAEYEKVAAEYAACRYLETVGTGEIDPCLKHVVELHDDESRALDRLVEIA